MNIQLFTEDDDRAVSPVIGVILMVAITVILAAVIGAFVLNLGSNVESNVQAGANVQFDSGAGTVAVTYTSNQNAEYLSAEFTDSNSDSAVWTLNETGAKITLGYASSNTTVSTSGSTSLVTTAPAVGTAGSSEFNLSTGDDDVSVVVTGVKGDQTTVLVDKSGTV